MRSSGCRAEEEKEEPTPSPLLLFMLLALLFILLALLFMLLAALPMVPKAPTPISVMGMPDAEETTAASTTSAA